MALSLRNFFFPRIKALHVRRHRQFLSASTNIFQLSSYNKTNYIYYFLKFIFGIKLYMFRTVPLSIIRSFSL